MRSDVRACVAYVVLRLISGHHAPAVYDHSGSESISIDGQVTSTNINIFDYRRGAYLVGKGVDGRFDLFDHGLAQRIDLEINGAWYQGYDYGSSCHFSGAVNGTTTALFDYCESGYFSYSL